MKTHNHALIFCNGDPPSIKILRALLQQKPFIICADGGANKARRLGIVPHVIIGDLDSILPETKQYFMDVEIIHNPDQHSTDFEKALQYLLKKRITNVIILGATGRRTDHTISNFSILQKYHSTMDLTIKDNHSDIKVVSKEIIFEAKIGSIISLLPLGKCTGIKTEGLRYPLHNESLELGFREGTSNEVVSSPVKISILEGELLLFKIK